MSTDARKHTSIAAGEKPTRAGLAGGILSISDIVPVANPTEANQIAAALIAAGQNLANTPLTVLDVSADPLFAVKYTKDGTNWTVVGGVPSTLTNRRQMSATNLFTNQTTFANFPVSADATAMASTYTKISSASKLLITMFGSANFISGSSQYAVLGMRVATTDYEVARTTFPIAINRQLFHGVLEISGLAAGALAVNPRFLAQTSSQFQFETGDFVHYMITESW